MGRPKGSKNKPESRVDGLVKRAHEAAMFTSMERTAPEIMRCVLDEARSAGAKIRKAGGGNITEDQPAHVIWKQLSSHQKIKAFLDYGVSMMVQPEVALRFMNDLLEDSKEGKMARLAMTRSLIMQTPKEINIDVTNKTGVMLVPTKADSLQDWLKDQPIGQTIDGDTND